MPAAIASTSALVKPGDKAGFPGVREVGPRHLRRGLPVHLALLLPDDLRVDDLVDRLILLALVPTGRQRSPCKLCSLAPLPPPNPAPPSVSEPPHVQRDRNGF